MLNADELASMRATSASALPDTCTITGDPPARGALNTVSGTHAPAARVPVFVGACRLRPVDGQETDTELGSLSATLGRYVVTLPHDATGVAVGQRFVLTASDDADAVGEKQWVRHVGWSSNQIDRRIIVGDLED